MGKINVSFLNELFLLCFNKKDVIEIVIEHLRYQYIPDQFGQYKKILKSMNAIYKNENVLPSFGVIAQHYSKDIDVQETLVEIKEAQIADKELMLSTLEEFIKKSMFVGLNTNLKTMYNDGKHDEAIALQAKESEEIVNFSIKKSGSYLSKVFGDFDKRLIDRLEKVESGADKMDKVPFGIEPLDIVTYGGIDVTDTALVIMRSGVGKSTWLKWTGVEAARKHRNVLHVQLEGSQEECELKYDQVWTATLYNDIRKGNIDDKKYEKLKKVVNYVKSHNNDIYIHAFEQFNTASMMDVRNLIVDFEKLYGHVDLVIIDYLKYLHPGDGIRYGVSTQDVKMKKENASDKIKNVAKEFGTRIIVADQASDVPKDVWNDPAKVLTRHNISGAKNLPDSYSYVITGNQTEEERRKGLMRLYCDKLRHYRLPDNSLKIYTNYNYGRFYDYKKTRETFWNKLKNQYEY